MVIKTASGICMHAAWAEDEEGTGFSLTKFNGAQYVGNYSDKSEEESTSWRSYEWQAIQEADDEEDDGTEIVEDESELDDEEEEEADGEIISSDDVIEGLMDDIGDTAEEVQSVGADSTATQNLSDTGLGNDNLLSGTNRGLAGWIIPDGFSAEAVAGTIYDDTADAVNYIKITCGTAGAGALQFDAGDLPEKLAHDGGSAYTLTADVAMSTCFSMPAYVGKPGGTAKQIEFGTIDNAARDLEEDSENDGVWVPAALTAGALGVAADGQVLCLDISAMPAGATLEIANLKIEEGAMVTPWKKSIKEVDETATKAQSTADTAVTDAATAQSTADTAKADAATAQSTADAAQSTADTAKKDAATAQTAAEAALTDAVIEYALGDSADTAPESGWSSETPEWISGKYIWQKTTVKDGKGNKKVTTTCIQGAKGEDAILLQIDSVNGTQFKNTGIATTLTVTIRYGDKTITKASQMYEAFGSSAYLTWSEKKMGETEFTPLSQGDSRIGDNGFYLTIGADDVDEKSVFECELNF